MDINVGPEFVLAGEATFTVSNGSGKHFTYHVYRSEPTERFPNPAHFLKALTGPDNTSDYTYVGLLQLGSDNKPPTVKMTRNSTFDQGSEVVKVAQWALRVIWQHHHSGYQLPVGYSIKHIGRCGRCGRALTVPASLDTGLGPECAELVGVEWKEREQRQQSVLPI